MDAARRGAPDRPLIMTRMTYDRDDRAVEKGKVEIAVFQKSACLELSTSRPLQKHDKRMIALLRAAGAICGQRRGHAHALLARPIL